MKELFKKLASLPVKPFRYIRFRMVISLALLLLLTMFIFVAVINTTGRSLFEDQILMDLSAVARSRSDQVAGIVDQDFEQAALVSSRTQLRLSLIDFQTGAENPDQKRNQMNSILADARNSVPAIIEIDIIALDGIVAASTETGNLDRDDSAANWFREGITGKFQSDFRQENGQYLYTLALPLANPELLTEELIGVVKLDLSLARMIGVLTDRTGLGESGEIILISSKDDQIIAMSPLRHRPEALLEPLNENSDLPFQAGLNSLAGQDGVVHERDYRGVDALHAYCHVPIDSADWGLIVKIDAAEALAPITVLQNRFLMVGGILLVLGGIFLFVGMNYAFAPVNKLRDGTVRLGRGELAHRIEVATDDEIGELAHSFNLMAENLHASRDSLVKESLKREQIAGELRLERDRARVYLDMAAGLLVAINRDQEVELINKKGCEILGLTVGEIIGKNWFDNFVPEEIAADMKSLFSMIMDGEFELLEAHEYPIVNSDGMQLLIAWQTTVLRNNTGKINGALSSGMDITERKRAEDKVRYISFHDQLTGLYNRYYLEEEMARLETTRRLPLSVIMADLNGLKLMNDTYGHEAGDRMLQAVADILRLSCREEDVIARWGGDEFIILLPETSIEEAELICRRIASVGSKTFVEDIPVSIALGAACKLDAADSLTDVLKRAENFMYKQKLNDRRKTSNANMAALLSALAKKSFESQEHINEMQKAGRLIGEKLNLSNSELSRLDLLVALHDIGKISVPGEILTKNEPLTAEEWEIIKKPPETGSRIAQATMDFAHVSEEILARHERWDGLGYPRGLAGKEIPLLARVIAIADAYEVMSSGRPYKEPFSHDEIVAELKRCSGTQFDPELIEMFLEALGEKGNR